MDQKSLVIGQIDLGRSIMEACIEEGIDVAAALWIRPSEDGNWYFYVATKLFEEQGAFMAIKAVLVALRKKNLFDLFDPLVDLKVIGARNPITLDVLEIMRKFEMSLATRYRGNHLGQIAIEEAYLYPTPLAIGQP